MPKLRIKWLENGRAPIQYEFSYRPYLPRRNGPGKPTLRLKGKMKVCGRGYHTCTQTARSIQQWGRRTGASPYVVECLCINRGVSRHGKEAYPQIRIICRATNLQLFKREDSWRWASIQWHSRGVAARKLSEAVEKDYAKARAIIKQSKK